MILLQKEEEEKKKKSDKIVSFHKKIFFVYKDLYLKLVFLLKL